MKKDILRFEKHDSHFFSSISLELIAMPQNITHDTLDVAYKSVLRRRLTISRFLGRTISGSPHIVFVNRVHKRMFTNKLLLLMLLVAASAPKARIYCVHHICHCFLVFWRGAKNHIFWIFRIASDFNLVWKYVTTLAKSQFKGK